MGGLSTLDPGQRLLHLDTSFDLVSPTTTYSSTSSPATEVAWNSSRPLTTPMPDYDPASRATMCSEKAAEANVNRLDSHSHGAQRQQLPSLSSLFGPPTSVRPLQSPMSDRPSSYSTTSPLDRPRLPSSSRSHHDSYFPPSLSPPMSQPRTSYDIKYDTERLAPHGMKRTASGPGSPRFQPMNRSRSDSRSDSEVGPKWALHQDPSRSEHSLESRGSAFPPSRDHFRLKFPGQKDPNQHFSEQRPTNGARSSPSTPTGTVLPQVTTSKDGLGPKIWTGTHFLPRFVRAADVPGEGLCYFYDDGSHCKTVIDGEVVNAHWGVTKAGKPRKRLAIACVTCREKKIKCDPDFPRCVQCEKFGRVCKFKNAPRGGHNGSPSTPPAELDDHRQLGATASESGSPVSPVNAMRHPTPEGVSNKRVKVDYETYVHKGEASPGSMRLLDHSKSQAATPMPPPEMPRIPESVLNRAWQTDPYVTDPHSINTVIAQFFVHIDSTMILQFLPEQTTKAWVVSSAHRKSPEDLMLLYSMLAVGVALSGGPKHIAFEYAQVAHYAHQYVQRTMGANCLQLAQSRILLAVYYLSVSRRREADEMISAAAATAACLNLNLELEKTREANIPSFPLGLNREGYREARRRTLWSLFMLERLNGMFPDRVTMINPDNLYIRLPADNRTFEEQLESLAPIFNPNELNLPKVSDQTYEIAAYLVEMVHIWAESESAVYKLIHRPASPEDEAARVRNFVRAMEHWHSVLPSRLLFSRYNLEAAAVAGKIGSYLTMHLLHHHAMMRLNRHRRLQQLSGEAKSNHIQKCQDHANTVVDIIDGLDGLLRARPMTLSVPPPMVATALAEAVDILTASRPLSLINNVIDIVRMMKPLVDTVGNVWEGSRGVRYLIDHRLHLLSRIRDRGSQPTSPMEGYHLASKPKGHKEDKILHWEISSPLEINMSRDMDIVYFELH